MSNKQSSVEWLDKQLASLNFDYITGQVSNKEYNDKSKQIREQAVAMHREEHGKTWDDSLDNLKARGMNEMRAYTDFDDYYAETYGGNNED
jgi:hypothetical protein